MVPCALIVTEGFLLLSPDGVDPLDALLTIAGAPRIGTAGGGGLPFTGDTEFDFPWCAGPPTTAGGVLDAIGGAPADLLLVAFA